MKTFLTYLKPHRWRMAVQFTIKFIGSIMDLFLPWLLAFMIDDIVPKQQVGPLYFYGGIMILCAIVAVFSNIIANRMSITISRDITKKLRHDLFAKISYLSAQQSDTITAPSLISRLTSDTYNVHQMVDRMQRLGIRAPILLVGGIIMTLTLEPVLTLVLITTLPILTFIILKVSKKGVALYSKTQVANDHLVRKIQENISGIRVIKALSKTDYEIEKFDTISREVVTQDQKASQTMALTSPAMNLLLNLGLTSVIIVGAFRVNIGLTQSGQIMAFLSYFAIILNALLMVTRIFTLYSKGAASAKRIESILLLQDSMPIKETNPGHNNYHVEFDHVSFSYNKIRPNLQNITFSLAHGESLGIIGETGSGKSTLIQLLLRFYDCDDGSIRIDNQDIRSIENQVLHTKFGIAMQNDLIYADTIYANIDFGRHLPQESILKAARIAQANFIDEKAGGLQYPLTIKGANLSGGQKQRILIARALAGMPEILILDDSSSALDYLTDAAVREGIARELPNTTTIIIAQRISSILHLDKIMMLEEGKIIGYGTHAKLLKTCPSYREIYDTQMGEMLK